MFVFGHEMGNSLQLKMDWRRGAGEWRKFLTRWERAILGDLWPAINNRANEGPEVLFFWG